MTTRLRSFATLILAGGMAMCLATPAVAQRGGSKASGPVFTPDAATVGTISGKVTLTGTPPAEKEIDMKGTPACASLHSAPVFTERVISNDKGEIRYAFVWIKKGLEDKTFALPEGGEMPHLDQVGCMYSPPVMAIQAGQVLELRNSDKVLHNVHAIGNKDGEPGKGKDYFNVSMATQGMKLERKDFNAADIMVMFKCEVHPWMFSFLGVAPHPYFAVTDANGDYKLANVPPGTYTLGVWQRRGGYKEVDVTLADKEDKSVSFEFDFSAAAPAGGEKKAEEKKSE